MGLGLDTVVQTLLQERPRVIAAAAMVVRDVHAADDIFQQVVLTALEHRGEIRDPDHLLAWALRAARHRAIDLGRKKQLRPLSSDALDLLEADWGDPAAGGCSDRVDALRRCVGKLNGPSRDLLQMKYSDGLTTATIAGRLGRSVDAVYQNLSRLHRSLRNCVARELDHSVVAGAREGSS